MSKKFLGLLLSLTLGLVLTLVAVFGSAQDVSAQTPDYSEEIKKVIEQIQLLNLINGLELSEEQMEFIIQKAEEAEQLRAELLEEVNGDNSAITGALFTFQELRDILLKGENIPDSLKAQTHEASMLTREMTLEYQDKILQLAYEIKEILQSHQLCALEDYVPCLIPPKPWAIGQEDGSEAGEKHLAKIREMPSAIFEEYKEEIAEQILEYMKMHLPRGYILDEEVEKEWIISIFEEARALSDVDFAIEKTVLIERLKSRYTPPTLPIDITVKIEKFLLNPEIIPLLESKLAAGAGL